MKQNINIIFNFENENTNLYAFISSFFHVKTVCMRVGCSRKRVGRSSEEKPRELPCYVLRGPETGNAKNIACNDQYMDKNWRGFSRHNPIFKMLDVAKIYPQDNMVNLHKLGRKQRFCHIISNELSVPPMSLLCYEFML